MTSPVIVAARRTPIGTVGHALAGVTADELAAVTLQAAHVDAGTPVIDDVIIGNCLGPGGNIARVAALRAGLGDEVPAVTVDRQCGSGLDAVLQAAARIRSGEATTVLAGGVESASTAPWRFWPPDGSDSPQRYTRAPFAPTGMADPEMGHAADALARVLGIGRREQDEWAAESFARAVTARARGAFDAELVAVRGVDIDARPRPGMTVERLGRLRPAFGPDGTGTAGNSCGISDGAATLAVTSEDRRDGRPGLRVLGGAVRGGDPALPGLGPGAAVPGLLDRFGLTPAEIGVVEITEAFAAQVIAAARQCGFRRDQVCPDGGAIAFGHPWGASGAILVVRLFHQLTAPDGPRYGLAACAVGGGQGIAMLFERVVG